MDTARSMARNAAAMMLSQVATWAATFVLTIYMARTLGASDYGKLQFAMAMMAIFAILVDFGTATLITREVARDRSRASDYLSNGLMLAVGTSLLAFLAMMGTVSLLHRPPEVVHLTTIFGASMVVMGATTFINSFLQGFEQAHFQAWGTVIDKVAKAIVVLLLLFQGYRLIPVAWAMLATSTVSLLWSGYWVLRVARPQRHRIHWGFMRQMVVGALPFLVFAVFARIYDKIDITMLTMMTRDAVVGWYGAAYRLFETLYSLCNIFAVVAFPVYARLSAGDLTVYRQAVHRGFAMLVTAAVGVCVTTLVLAGAITDLLYSRAEFPGTAAALRILALALACMYLNTMFVIVLQTMDRQSQWMKVGALAAVINPIVNYLLIPKFGHLGAAMTTVVTEGMLMVMDLRLCPPGILDRSDVRALLRALLAGALLAAGLAFGLRWGLLPALMLGVPIYLLAITGLGVISPADIALIKATLLKRKISAE